MTDNIKNSIEYKKIMTTIKGINKIAARVSACQAVGFTTQSSPYMKGGAGTIKIMSDHVRVSLNYPVGKNRESNFVVLKRQT